MQFQTILAIFILGVAFLFLSLGGYKYEPRLSLEGQHPLKAYEN